MILIYEYTIISFKMPSLRKYSCEWIERSFFIKNYIIASNWALKSAYIHMYVYIFTYSTCNIDLMHLFISSFVSTVNAALLIFTHFYCVRKIQIEIVNYYKLRRKLFQHNIVSNLAFEVEYMSYIYILFVALISCYATRLIVA